MAQRGGKRPGAGRKPGQVSPVKLAIAELAKGHADLALNTLVQVAQAGESEAARVSAANAILDRAFGKPIQTNEHSGPNGGPVESRVTHTVDPKDVESAVAKLKGL